MTNANLRRAILAILLFIPMVSIIPGLISLDNWLAFAAGNIALMASGLWCGKLLGDIWIDLTKPAPKQRRKK